MEHSKNCMCHLCLEPPLPAPTQKYRVHGFCLVPTTAEIEVEARSDAEALQKAMAAWKAEKRSMIVGNSGDESSAFDWHPTAELMTPNAELTGRASAACEGPR